MIVRIKRKSHNYSIIDNTPLSDSRLSYRARGVLAYLLTKPDEWEVNMKEIESGGKEGREAIQAAFKELQALGYASLNVERGKGGVFAGKKWTINECPDGKTEKPFVRSSDGKTEKPKTRITVPIIITDTVVSTELEDDVDARDLEAEIEKAIQDLKADKEKKAPPIPRTPPAPLQPISQLSAENPAIKNTFINSRKLPPERFEEMVAAFDSEMDATKEHHHGESDLIKHFLNWAGNKIRIEQETKQRPVRSTPAASKSTITQAGRDVEHYRKPQAF